MQEKSEQLKSKAFSFAFKMKKGPKLQNWKKEKQKKEREQAHRWDNNRRKKKQTNKQKIKQIKWINEKHKHEKNFHFVIMKSTYII